MDSQKKRQDNSEQIFKEAVALNIRSGPIGYVSSMHDDGINSISLLLDPNYRYETMKKYDLQSVNKMIETLAMFDEMLSKVKDTDKYYAAIVAVKIFYLGMSLVLISRYNQKLPKLFGLPKLKAMVDSLEPLKLKPEIIFFYLSLIQQFGEFSLKLEKQNSASDRYNICIEVLKKGIKDYEDYGLFVKKKPWSINDILDHPDFNKNFGQLASDYHEEIEKVFEACYKNLQGLLFKVYIELDAYETAFEFGLNLIKLELDGPLKELVSRAIPLSKFLERITMEYLNRSYLKQANHLIAISMYLLVEYRRSLLEAERHTVDPYQARISIMYAYYGLHLMKIVEGVLIDKALGRMPKENSNCKRFVETDGLKVYEEVFPTEYVQDNKVLQSIHKKTILWLERAEKLNKTNPSDETADHISKVKGDLKILKIFLN